MENSLIQELLNTKEIEKVMDPRNYLGTALEQIEQVVKKTRQERRGRSLQD
jgi:adenylosuccinate lyase